MALSEYEKYVQGVAPTPAKPATPPSNPAIDAWAAPAKLNDSTANSKLNYITPAGQGCPKR
jgi:hypothetical protein